MYIQIYRFFIFTDFEFTNCTCNSGVLWRSIAILYISIWNYTFTLSLSLSFWFIQLCINHYSYFSWRKVCATRHSRSHPDIVTIIKHLIHSPGQKDVCPSFLLSLLFTQLCLSQIAVRNAIIGSLSKLVSKVQSEMG